MRRKKGGSRTAPTGGLVTRRGLGIQAIQDFEQLGITGHAALEVSDDAFPVDDEDGALDALAVGFDGVVGVGNGAVSIGEEGEGEVELCLVVLVRLYGGGVDSQDCGVGCFEFGPVVPQGLELAVSTGGVVSTVENEQYVLFALEAAEGNVLPIGGSESEVGGSVANGKGHVGTSSGIVCSPV